MNHCDSFFIRNAFHRIVFTSIIFLFSITVEAVHCTTANSIFSSEEWNNALNWEGRRIPASGDHISIAHDVIIAFTTTEFSSVTVENGASLSVATKGNLTLNTQNGILTVNGTGAFTISGGLFTNEVLLKGSGTSTISTPKIIIVKHNFSVSEEAVLTITGIIANTNFEVKENANVTFTEGGNLFENEILLIQDQAQVAFAEGSIDTKKVTLENEGKLLRNAMAEIIEVGQLSIHGNSSFIVKRSEKDPEEIISSIPLLDKDISFKVYPIPALNHIYIESENAMDLKECDFEIFDEVGRKYPLFDKSYQTERWQLAVHHLQKGLYILKISNQNLVKVERILIQ
ncbi:T9SS type A sorting domain-containing protein [Flammeovirga aprica]|uniref:T9SS type A sorting domain-containing protein n=1 Tax=Flammeovirga aprica JL-4 TaxID=694437 RepID=A0A7X9RWS1_9BACT|nr:T9SS type A sorting domain-containing protein [Flammeovirga aprica]NME70140.1 T9SS type A sorting domain-containing protein [Flammeovirga aprica JL-4]